MVQKRAMEKQETFMQAVENIALEGLHGIVKKGALVTVLMLFLGGTVWYFEREKRDFQKTIIQQDTRIDTLEKDMMTCIINRMEQSIEIKTLKEQVATLIGNTRRKK